MAEPEKYFISPDELRLGAVTLARKIYDDGFFPDLIIGLWRGGAPIGLYVHEVLKCLGVRADYIPVITRGYKEGVDNQLPRVAVQGLDALAGRTQKRDKVIVIDDVWDSGRSIDAFLEVFEIVTGEQHPLEVRVGTVYFKPQRNKSARNPNYYVQVNEAWLVFPHEFGDCTAEEIERNMGPEIGKLLKKE